MNRAVRVGQGLTALLLVAGAALVVGRAGAQAGASPFSATAQADGARVSVTVRRFLILEQFADVGAPAAQAVLTSGESVAYAAMPYPGELALNAGLITYATGVPVPESPYPLIATSTHPAQPEQEVNQGVVSLRAASAVDASTASAVAGMASTDASVGAARSGADVVRGQDGSVRAVAQTTSEVVVIGGVLRIGTVTSTAEATQAPGGELQRTQSFVAEGASVAGQPVQITDQGLVVGNSPAALPTENPLTDILAESGIAVRYLSAVDTESGVVAAGIAVDVLRDIEGVGEAVVTYTFGRASATVAAGEPGSVGGAPPPAVDAPAPEQSTGSSAGGTATPTATGSSTIGSGAGTPASSAASSSPPPASASSGSGEELAFGRAGVVADGSAVTFYFVLMVGALVMAVSVQLVRILGVRLPWSS